MKQGKKDFIGKWHITEMSEWNDDYVNEEVQAFINIERAGSGEFPFGFVQGSMSGDFKEDIYDFTWEGSDECDSASGDGWMEIKEEYLFSCMSLHKYNDQHNFRHRLFARDVKNHHSIRQGGCPLRGMSDIFHRSIITSRLWRKLSEDARSASERCWS